MITPFETASTLLDHEYCCGMGSCVLNTRESNYPVILLQLLNICLIHLFVLLTHTIYLFKTTRRGDIVHI